MALGFIGNGGSSSSSSNLSPLAPPFTVDRSNPKPNSNPLVPLTEPPYAALPFQSSYHNWQYSDSSYNEYGYLGSHSVSSTNAHMPPLNPSVTAATDAFTFHRYSTDKPKNSVQTKPYYTTLVSSSVVDDAAPLVALNEPSYDVLPNSCVVAPLSGSSQVDYTRSLSGLEYTPSWGGVWNNRLADEETNDAGSYVCKDYMKQADGPSKCDASAISRERNVDVWGRRSQFVTPSTGKLNDEFSSMQDHMFIPNVSQGISFSGMCSTLQESHAQEQPSLHSAPNFCYQQNSCSSSYDKWFPSLDPCMNNYVAVNKNSPAIVIRPPSNSTSSKVANAATPKGLVINNKDVGRHNPSNQKEPIMSSSDGKSGCLVSSGPIRSNHIFNASPSTGKEELSNTAKNGKEFELPDLNVPDGFTLDLDNSKGFCSVEYSSEGLEHYNPAVDSPCWKGASSASYFSLSEASEAVTPEAQICPLCADDNVNFSCPPLHGNSEYKENGYVELGSLLCPERLSNANCPIGDQTSVDVVKAGFIYPRSSGSDEVHFSNDINKKRKECDLPNDPKSDCVVKLSHAKQPDLGKGDFIPERESKMCAGVADSGLNTKDASEDGTLSFCGMESTSFSPCSGENVNKVKMHATELRPKMDVQMLVDTISKLSELLLVQCSNDASAVSEQNHEALKCVINNLDTCVSRRIVNMTPTQNSMFTQQCTSSHQCGNLPDSNKGGIAGRPPVTKEEGASSQCLFDHDSTHVVKRNRDISGKVVEKFPDFVSLGANTDNVKDDNMVQAIKGVLEKDFNCEEETQPETLLYKNLWLEAEAALCSMSYRARFNRMKIEMEKCMSYKAKDAAECSMAVDKLLNSKVSPSPSATQKVISESEDSPLSDNNVNDSRFTTKVVDDVEASTLGRFQNLKCRTKKSNSITAKGRYNQPLLGDPTQGGSLDVTVKPYLKSCSIVSDKSKEFGSCIGRFECLLPSGWCDGSSSDWEDVPKDEFASQN